MYIVLYGIYWVFSFDYVVYLNMIPFNIISMIWLKNASLKLEDQIGTQYSIFNRQ